jgi:citronellol/citronellal dehydrogenase
MFAGRSVIIAGGGGEIGRGIALTFAALGAEIILLARSEAGAQQTCDLLGQTDTKVAPYLGDNRDVDWVDETFSHILSAEPDIATLVNCAGGQFAQAAEDISAKGWKAVVDTNLNASWYLTQALVKHWCRPNAACAITHITLSHGRGLPGMAHSAAARAAVESLTKTCAIEWAQRGFRINCIEPGLMDTETLRRYGEGVTERLQAIGNPMGRFGSPEELAAASVFLASPLASFMTGTTMKIDGGQFLWGDNWTIEKPAVEKGKK